MEKRACNCKQNVKTHFRARGAQFEEAVGKLFNRVKQTPQRALKQPLTQNLDKYHTSWLAETGSIRHYPSDVENAMVYPHDYEDDEDEIS